jgi:hypothetical protein
LAATLAVAFLALCGLVAGGFGVARWLLPLVSPRLGLAREVDLALALALRCRVCPLRLPVRD